MNKFILVVGGLAFLLGILWIGQGLGYIHWPASSFMISQIKWAYYGAGLACFGAFLIIMYCLRKI